MNPLSSLKPFFRRFVDAVLPLSSAVTYSQSGEDVLIRERFLTYSRLGMLLNRPRVSPGFYVDVGAYSPKRLSNTYWLYANGWRGITIEPDPSAAWTFRLTRPRDKHLAVAVSKSDGQVKMAIGDYSAVNKVLGPAPADPLSHTSFRTVPCRTLTSILDEHLPSAQRIDLLSIDCEGHEMDILESNNWVRYVPNVICIEDYEWCYSETHCSQISAFLSARGYRAFGWAGASVLWAHNSFPHRNEQRLSESAR